MEKKPPETRPTFDPECYLCPGNSRSQGQANPTYSNIFVFDNDFPALLPNVTDHSFDFEDKGLLVAATERGICRVLCFSPRHDLTIAEMELPDLHLVVDEWAKQYQELGSLDFVKHVQIFENRGAMMGSSNPHPHGQIWANQTVPNEAVKEGRAFSQYQQQTGHCLLCDYLETEMRQQSRIVAENEHFVALVPFWAIWPYETMVLSKTHVGSIPELDSAKREALAAILKNLTTRYDNLFEVSFPYSMGFHQPPTDGQAHPDWHLHAHFYPPLLRSATIRKFVVGYELLANSQRDITAEASAERLRSLPDTHYSHS
jgi:UDPglucose--hexose-1-phosphate uridylyltransferase